MKLNEYKKQLKNPLRPRTVTFLLNENNVLLGFKKRGFGKGYFLGIGGKVEVNETIEDGAKRELEEEISITNPQLQKVGILNFYFPHITDESWNQQVIVFITENWQGEPQESEEIKPQWFQQGEIPYDKMWDDAKYWLPKILESKQIDADFLFDSELHVIEQKIKSL